MWFQLKPVSTVSLTEYFLISGFYQKCLRAKEMTSKNTVCQPCEIDLLLTVINSQLLRSELGNNQHYTTLAESSLASGPEHFLNISCDTNKICRKVEPHVV